MMEHEQRTQFPNKRLAENAKTYQVKKQLREKDHSPHISELQSVQKSLLVC